MKTQAKRGNKEDGAIFVDKFGREYRHLTNINSAKHLQEILHQNWLYSRGGKSANCGGVFVCKLQLMGQHNRDAPHQYDNCPFRGILAKNDNEFFIHGEHNHPINRDDYVDHWGRVWPFLAKAETAECLSEICKLNWLKPIQYYKLTTVFACRRNRWHKCTFRAIFEKKRQSVFVQGEHNHALDENIFRKKSIEPGTDYIDRFGKRWHFIKKMRNDRELEEICRKYCLYRWGKNKRRIFFACKERMKKSKKKVPPCQMKGIFVKENKCFYMLSGVAHNHRKNDDDKLEELRPFTFFTHTLAFFYSPWSKVAGSKKINPDNGEEEEVEDYVDHFGKHWRFLCHTENAQELRKICPKYMLKLGAEFGTRIYVHCGRNAGYYKNDRCQVRGIFVKSKSKLYVRGEHNHPIIMAKNNQINVANDGDHNVLVADKPPREGPRSENEKEIEFVEQIQHQHERKCCPPMKREGEEGRRRPIGTGSMITIDDEETTASAARFQKNLKQWPVKKEEPKDVAAEEPTAAGHPAGGVGGDARLPGHREAIVPTKMLLRERKRRINYAER